jgi:nicotinamide mononucleotide transporter
VTSPLEIAAVILAVLYLLLAVKENILCWAAAFFSTLLFLFLFWDAKLYMESALQLYYLAMAIYGWRQWRGSDNSAETAALVISRWTPAQHLRALGLIALLTLASGYALSTFSDAQRPFLDSLTTWGGVVATFMVAKKILENWLYWLVIDSLSVALYLDRELYATAMLFVVYLVIIAFGWSAWLKTTRNSTASA